MTSDAISGHVKRNCADAIRALLVVTFNLSLALATGYITVHRNDFRHNEIEWESTL